MSWKIVEVTKPHWCCGRCGATRADARTQSYRDCFAYGAKYDSHIWVYWEPYKEEQS